MSVNRPYRRTFRQFVDGEYAEGGRAGYVVHRKFAESPDHYVRAFLLLQKDLRELFEYVEPADTNLACFSYRIHELLLRACVEVEANCKAILSENGYDRAGDWNMNDYKKIEHTHLLSAYEVRVPSWTGEHELRRPFTAWQNGGALPWYTAYNTTKHDRHSRFGEATFQQMLDACCGLLVILSAQFYTYEFSPLDSLLSLEGPRDGMESGIGGYFRVRFPANFPVEKRYEFNWQDLKDEEDPFQKFDYQALIETR